MANLFPSIFPYAPDSPEMKKLGFQTEFEVYTKLGSLYDETVDILCELKFYPVNKDVNIPTNNNENLILPK